MRIPRRAAASMLALTVLAGGLSACGTPAASRATNAAGGTAKAVGRTTTVATVRTSVSPYDSRGRLTVTPHRVVRGSCFTASIASPSPRSYRCFSGNMILDPCLAPPAVEGTTAAQVACLATPWSAATVVRLTAPLPSAAPIGEHGRPWAFVLDTGARCVAATGTVPSVADVALPYRCTHGTAAAVVDAHARTVIVEYGHPTGPTLVRHAVRTLWRT